MSVFHAFQYRSIWPNGNEHIAPRVGRLEFFQEFDHAIDVLKAAGVDKANWPHVEVQTLETTAISPWKSYGDHVTEQINASRKA